METEENVQSSLKLASTVSGNCEFLTLVRHNFSQRTDQARESFKKLSEYMQDRKCKLNAEAFLQLIIELAYFYYACKNFQIAPVIGTEDVRVEESSMRSSEKRFSIVVWFKMQETPMDEGAARDAFTSLLEYVREQLAEYLQSRREEKDRTPQELQHDLAVDTFFNQFAILANAQYYQEHESHFFLCLEQTTLFYEYSMFYRIKNCSMLDFIKCNEARFSHFRLAKVKDESMVIEYNKEKNRGKCEQEVLRSKEREIELNISHFFKTINDKNYFEIQSKNDKDQTYRVKFNYTIRERERFAFEEVLKSMQSGLSFADCARAVDGKRPLSEIEYFIEYSSEKNHICVKLYNPSIVSNIETSDFLIFQSNVLTFDPVNVSIELSDPKLKGQEKTGRKVVTFKGSSSFNVKEPPLEKILLLMDITLIASKIYEPELNHTRYGSTLGKDYHRVATVSAKISHYTKMFLKIAKKIYSD